MLDKLCLFLAIIHSALISFLSVPFFVLVPKIGQKFQRGFGLGWVWLMGIRVQTFGWENLPRAGGAILAPNHESMFDIPLLCSLGHPLCWLSKEEVGKLPFIGWSMKAMGCYFVKRNRSGHDLNVMKDVEDGLKRGASIVIFPEGTRTRTGKLLPFKKGAFKTAQNSGVPIVPIAISGTYQIAPPGQWPSRGHSVIVRIGSPMFFSPEETLESAQKRYRENLIKLLSIDRGSAYNGVT
ncbi:MAG: 1-acyl-sn-glycerol-3-phosphate acyltransferase [Proteobacteria bacterium]|jgi:1-acyl-sn-glycerol-3-phosphate acyltransferase|nr:1-acyl-sn-glycerol-3-phosphate acyltransferase [Pseudomonadota bacterium]